MNFVLVPGFMTDEDLWADVMGTLEALGPVFHADTTRDASIEDMARRLLAEAPPRFVLIGFSMGGYVAREAARLAPERVSRLVLIATSARGDNQIQVRRKAAAEQARATTFKGLSRSAALAALRPGTDDAAAIQRVRSMSERLGAEVFRRQSMIVRRGDLDRLAEIDCPTLVIAAAEDQLRTQDEARELQAGIPGSRLIVIAGTGHMIPIEAPAELARALNAWLAQGVAAEAGDAP